MNKSIIFFLLLMVLAVWSCKDDTATQTNTDAVIEEPVVETPPKVNVKIPAFNRDSAYQFVADQVEFGPREPNSEAHQKCKAYLAAKLKSFGALVIEQDFKAKDYRGVTLNSTNIIGQINPDHERRILLAAHWDSRFMAEEDSDPARKNEPILGADDGASGVGVLLEIARIISENPIDLGVDIVFFDAEDQGSRGGANETWCLGAQHWAQNLHSPGYSAEFGILLDMVGARGALFQQESLNNVHTPAKVAKIHRLYNRVWGIAQGMGKGNLFMPRKIGGLIDDHYFVNMHTNIPMIDIINKPIQSTSGFGPHWHTHGDDMSVIDRTVLGAVGQVVIAVLYKTSGYSFSI